MASTRASCPLKAWSSGWIQRIARLRLRHSISLRVLRWLKVRKNRLRECSCSIRQILCIISLKVLRNNIRTRNIIWKVQASLRRRLSSARLSLRVLIQSLLPWKVRPLRLLRSLTMTRAWNQQIDWMRSNLISHLRRAMANISFLLKERSKKGMFIRRLMYMLWMVC